MNSHQRALLDFIKAFIAEHRYAPSFDEMRHGVGLKSKSSVHSLLGHLERDGHIIRLKHARRAIELVEHRLSNVPTQLLLDEIAKRGGIFDMLRADDRVK